MQAAHIPAAVTHGGTRIVSKAALQVIYSAAPIATKRAITAQLGPLQPIFDAFLDHEQRLVPPNETTVLAWFDACSDPAKTPAELLSNLRRLAPGNGQIGFQQVNRLVTHLRQRIGRFLQAGGHELDLLPHDHAFGSGGDFWKTGHATTNAAIVAAPLLPICKTGTTNVTAEHGSYQAAQQIGYDEPGLNQTRLNAQLRQHGFAFVPLSALGFPYSESLRSARKQLWNEAVVQLQANYRDGDGGWPTVVRSTPVPLDIFKIVSPNAQVFNPVHHSTGVCHLSMLPYVLGIYLELGTTGMIAHCYDGIDEISNATSAPLQHTPNNLVIHVELERLVIAEFAPEDLGFTTAGLSEIEEEKLLADDAATFWRVLAGTERGPKRDFVVANAAVLLVAGQQVPPSGDLIAQLSDAARVAERLIDSGRAYTNFTQLLAS